MGGLFAELVELLERLTARAGRHTVGANLAWLAAQFIASPAVPLAREAVATEADPSPPAHAHHGMGDLEAAVGRYLAAEQGAGRVLADLDTGPIGALAAGAIHNLVVAGAAWPLPSEGGPTTTDGRARHCDRALTSPEPPTTYISTPKRRTDV